jgi:hypothetical protein
MFPVKPTQPSSTAPIPVHKRAGQALAGLVEKAKTAWKYAQIDKRVKRTLGPDLYCQFEQCRRGSSWDQRAYEICMIAVKDDLHPSEPPC